MHKRLIIVGAGGLGRIVYDILAREDALEPGLAIGGFLDTRADTVLPEGIDVPFLGSPLEYKVQAGDIFIPAVGDNAWRRKLVAPLVEQGAEFYQSRYGAFISDRFRYGPGSMITPGAVVSTDCSVGQFSYVDTYVVVGHDVQIGDYCMIGAMCFMAGGVRVGNDVTMHPRATIAKGIKIGDGATVGIGSVVVKDVPAGATVFGNPARVIA